MSKPSVTVQATKTSIELLEALNELGGAGVTELADELNLPKSTVHNHLNTLCETEYIVREGDTYHVSLRFLELGEHSRNRLQIYETARPEVSDMAEQTGELANLAVEEYGRGVYLHLAEAERAVQLDTYAGMRVHLHCTALGKSILAHLPDERVEEILDTHGLPERTPNTITNRDELLDQLEEIRERGYAYDHQERLQGLRCVAAPITTPNTGVVGALSLAGPTSRMKGDRFHEEIPQRLLDAVNVIELNMTYA